VAKTAASYGRRAEEAWRMKMGNGQTDLKKSRKNEYEKKKRSLGMEKKHVASQQKGKRTKDNIKRKEGIRYRYIKHVRYIKQASRHKDIKTSKEAGRMKKR